MALVWKGSVILGAIRRRRSDLARVVFLGLLALLLATLATGYFWTFLGRPDTRWISVAINQTCTTEDFLLFGKLIADAIAESDRRVVLLASGGMTHRFFDFRDLRRRESQRAPDNIYDRKYYDADMQVLEMLEKGDHAGVIADMPNSRTP